MGGVRAGPAALSAPQRRLPPAGTGAGPDLLPAGTAAALPSAGHAALQRAGTAALRLAAAGAGSYNQPYYGQQGRYDGPNGPPQAYRDERRDNSYSSNEIVQAGHSFFGTVTQGLARVIEYAFQQQGRPNGYILGQDAGGAFVAGLRYGEGMLYTKDAGTQRVYWQGPSIGYDAGGDGSKVMVLVYNLRDPSDIYRRFGGVDGSAYMVGGVGLTFQKNGDLVTAPIRTGVGLRLGANVGYLKYTRAPTWNPF